MASTSFKRVLDVLSKSEIPSNSVLADGFMKKDAMVPYTTKTRRLKKMRKEEREKTKGKKWFDMPRTELTEERKNDLTILQMRNVLDPKRFYKKNETKVLPKYFQIGTVVESAADFYHSRIPKKQRKRTIVEELLSDVNFAKIRQKYRRENPTKKKQLKKKSKKKRK